MDWKDQIKIEPGVILVFSRAERLYTLGKYSSFGADLTGEAKANLGNINTSGVGTLMIRAGYRMPQTFQMPKILTGSSTDVAYQDPNVPEGLFRIYGFGGFTGSVIGRNIFLDGNTVANSLSTDKNILLGEFSAGVAAEIDPIKATFAWNYRTKEFKQQIGEQQFLSITLSCMF